MTSSSANYELLLQYTKKIEAKAILAITGSCLVKKIQGYSEHFRRALGMKRVMVLCVSVFHEPHGQVKLCYQAHAETEEFLITSRKMQ